MNRLSSIIFVFILLGVFASCTNTAKEDNVNINTTPDTKEVKKEESEKKGYDIGDIVEDFELENVDGSMVSLASLGKDIKGATVVFTCNTCPYAVMYEDRLAQLGPKVKEAGFPMIAIMPNNLEVRPMDNLDEMAKRAKEKGFSFPYVLDAGQKIYPKFGATKTPEVYILEKTEKGFQVAYHGAIDDNVNEPTAVKVNYVAKAVGALSTGNEVEPKRTKAIGCTIKVKKG